jgi:SAM-dependent methyltransferase
MHFPKPSEPVDLLKVYELARHLNSTIDLTAPVHGPFRVTVRFPILPIIPGSPAPATTPLLPDEAARVPAPPVAIAPVRVSAPERRKRHRYVTSIVASMTDGTRTWTGTVANLSSGGASLAMPADMPMLSTQSVEVILRTDVSILELQGSAYVRTMVEISVPVPSVSPRVLVLVFSPPPEPESAVLDSMIETAAMGGLQLTLEVRLVSGRSLTPLSSFEGMVSPPIITPTENHREAIRIKLETPVGFELTDRAGSKRRLSGFVQNVSRTGACIRISPNPGSLDGVATLYFAALGRPTPPEPTAPDAVFPAQIIWAMGSGPESLTTSPMKYESALQIGLSFQALTPYAERELNRALHHRLMSEEGSDDLSATSAVISVPRECRNSRGLSIAIVDDHLRLPVTPNKPIVIIAPGFGQTATDYTALGHYLARHHFRVLRYDHTNHLGQSEGELQQSSLRSMQGDLLKVIEFVHHTWPGVPVGVIASDLAARAALKAAAQSPVLDLLLLINPVTDLQAMLQSVHGHDLVTDYRFGLRRGMTNLLSLNVNHDHFVGEVISGHFTDLASSLQDLRGVRAPLVIVTAPVSPLGALPPTDLPHAFVTALGTRLGVINLPLLPVVPEPRLAPEAIAAFQPILEQVAAAMNIQVRPVELGHEIHRAPVRQHRVELERTRLRHNVSQMTREALWQAYQQQLPQLANLHEHWKFLDDLYRSLTPLDPGTIVMDIGSGHDELARVMMVNQAYRARHRGWVQEAPPEFVALGRSRDSLAETRRTFRTLFQEMESDFGSGLSIHPPVALETIQADWTTALPFGNGALHRIVCNLSLPFVHSPLAVMRELHRVLHPQGRLILTAFQAITDLSVLYRQHLRRLNQDEFGPEAQVVLHYLGRVREAIRHGLLHTYDRETLSHLFHQVGLTSSQITVGLNGHALLAIVGKREFL